MPSCVAAVVASDVVVLIREDGACHLMRSCVAVNECLGRIVYDAVSHCVVLCKAAHGVAIHVVCGRIPWRREYHGSGVSVNSVPSGVSAAKP